MYCERRGFFFLGIGSIIKKGIVMVILTKGQEGTFTPSSGYLQEEGKVCVEGNLSLERMLMGGYSRTLWNIFRGMAGSIHTDSVQW